MTQLEGEMQDEKPGTSAGGAKDEQDLQADLPLEIKIQFSLDPKSSGAGDCQVIIAKPSLEVICNICCTLELYEDTTCSSYDVEAGNKWYYRVCLDGGEQAMVDLSVMIRGDLMCLR